MYTGKSLGKQDVYDLWGYCVACHLKKSSGIFKLRILDICWKSRGNWLWAGFVDAPPFACLFWQSRVDATTSRRWRTCSSTSCAAVCRGRASAAAPRRPTGSSALPSAKPRPPSSNCVPACPVSEHVPSGARAANYPPPAQRPYLFL